MIILIDAIGVLTIIALGHQGYKEALGIRKSFLLPALCSVLIFYKIFPLVHGLVSSVVSNGIIAGILTIALVAFTLMTFFYKLFLYFLHKFEQKFFLPEFPLHPRQVIGVFLGVVTGYVFIAGVIESLDHSLARHSAKKHSVLANSVFYKIAHKKEKQIDYASKIDNIPALKVLYCEENVTKFDFSEAELVAILQMIRAISNQEAQILLTDINDGKPVEGIYKTLLEMYVSQDFIAEKYQIPPEVFASVVAKVG